MNKLHWWKLAVDVMRLEKKIDEKLFCLDSMRLQIRLLFTHHSYRERYNSAESQF